MQKRKERNCQHKRKEIKTMTNYLKVLHDTNVLLMDKAFAKNSSIVGSREYEMLQDARKAYPNYKVETRKIKRNSAKENYKGLTYEFMERYILTHEPAETLTEVLDEFSEMLLISKCHSKAFRYPVIKSWFIEKYPEIKEFGMSKLKVVMYARKEIA